MTLTSGLVGGTSTGLFTVIDGGGDDTVDASGVTNNTAIISGGGRQRYLQGR